MLKAGSILLTMTGSKDEYDILMNTIIYLLLNTVKLQTELTENVIIRKLRN